MDIKKENFIKNNGLLVFDKYDMSEQVSTIDHIYKQEYKILYFSWLSAFLIGMPIFYLLGGKTFQVLVGSLVTAIPTGIILKGILSPFISKLKISKNIKKDYNTVREQLIKSFREENFQFSLLNYLDNLKENLIACNVTFKDDYEKKPRLIDAIAHIRNTLEHYFAYENFLEAANILVNKYNFYYLQQTVTMIEKYPIQKTTPVENQDITFREYQKSFTEFKNNLAKKDIIENSQEVEQEIHYKNYL